MTSDWLGLAGLTAVVTGAASGIGRACAHGLAEQGVRVVGLDRDAIEGMDFHAVDVADPASVTDAAASIGSVDILVNAAGISRPGTLLDMPFADWKTVLDVNMLGYLHCVRAFAPSMVELGRGVLVHVASISATNPQGASSGYSVGKAAVRMMSQQLAVELGPHGVRSNCVSPGLVRTAMSEAYYRVEGVLERRNAVVPLRRVAQPEDIADVVTFLASDRARYISGADIVVDGAFSQTLMSSVPRPGYD